MRILQIHNHYQNPGGEDIVAKQEANLLRQHGHTVDVYSRSNDEVKSYSLEQKTRFPLAMVWNQKNLNEISELVNTTKPDVVHFHNTHFVISPAAYYAASQTATAVVQTVHNYRLICPSAMMTRANKPCTACVGRILPLPGIIHACYRNSRFLTALVGMSVRAHHALNTWRRQIDAYIALTQFMKEKLVEGGIAAERIFVKPNFTPAPTICCNVPRQHQVLYVGRLSEEKGVQILLEAWRDLRDIPLVIFGEGPQKSVLERFASKHNLTDIVTFRGRQPHDEILHAMQTSTLLIVPSICYESFSLVLIEAYSNKLPVIASNIGGPGELVIDGETGFLFEPGDRASLVESVRHAMSDTDRLHQMGSNAFAHFQEYYAESRNYEMLMQIYANAIDHRQRKNQRINHGAY